VVIVTHSYMYSDDTRLGTGDSWNPHDYGVGNDAHDGDEMWDELVKLHENVFLVVNGHVLNDGLGQLTSTGDNGNSVDQVLANYQMKANGGNGWLRYYTFKPSEDKIYAYTYSPTLGTFDTSADNQFTLDYDFTSADNYSVLGANSNVASGSGSTMSWQNLSEGSQYQWYATANDGNSTATGAVWSFSTSVTPPSISSTTPADDATGVALDIDLTITFTETVSKIGTGTVSIYKSNDDSLVETIAVTGSLVTGSGTNTITIDPTQNFESSTGYYIHIGSNAFYDTVGSNYAGISDSTSWNFTTVDETSPTVSALSPADGATGVSTGTTLQVTFNESTGTSGTGYVTLYRAGDDAVVERINTATGAVTGSGADTVTIRPSSALSFGTGYYLQIDARAFPDAAGNFYAGIADSTTWNFRTQSGGVLTLPADRGATLRDNTSTDLSSAGKSGSQSVRLSHGGERVADVTFNFSTGDRDFSDVTFTRDDTNHRSLVHGLNGHTGVSGTYTMYVKKSSSHDRIRICSGKETAGCTSDDSWSFLADSNGNIVSTNGGFDTSGISVSVAGGDWVISSLTATAGQGEAGSTGSDTSSTSTTTTTSTQGSGGRRGSPEGMAMRIAAAQERLLALYNGSLGRALAQRTGQKVPLAEKASAPAQEVPDEPDVFASDEERRLYRAVQKVEPRPVAQHFESIAERRGRLFAMGGDVPVLYADVPTDAWYAPYVAALVDDGVASGYVDETGKPKGEFGVANPITLAEILKMALEAAGEEAAGLAPPRNASARGTWAGPYVAVAEKLNLLVFTPGLDVHAPATRGEVLQVILEAMGIPTGIKVAAPFSDVPADHPYAQAIATAAAYGLVSGDTDAWGVELNTYRPYDPINRAEASKIIALVKEVMR